MATITLKGREIPLIYTVLEMKEIQEEIASLGDFQYVILGRNKDDEEDNSLYGGPDHLNAVAKLIRILGNAGLEEQGEEPNLTDKWVLRNMKPGLLLVYALGAFGVINEGNQMEAKEEETGPVDEGLEEQQAKKQPGN